MNLWFCIIEDFLVDQYTGIYATRILEATKATTQDLERLYQNWQSRYLGMPRARPMLFYRAADETMFTEVEDNKNA